MRDSPQSDAALLHEALLNEICLDRRYIESFKPNGDFIPYKVMRQVALQRRIGLFLKPTLLVLATIIPALLLFNWFIALARSSHCTASASGSTLWAIATIEANKPLIGACLPIAGVTTPPCYLSNLALELPRVLGFWNVLATGWSLLLLLWRILVIPREPRMALLLHARDAVAILMLARFARQQPDHVFATECHYQRWSYVLSHRASLLILVQHGALDGRIALPCLGGEVALVVARDEESANTFRRYYHKINEVRVHEPHMKLHPMPCDAPAIFLASSFPSIDYEILFAKAWRKQSSIPLIVKLHPAHLYDRRGVELMSLSHHQANSSENPECAVFVSYNSSMESLYRKRGIKTVAISQMPTITEAIGAALLAIADYHQPVNETSSG